jgi:hypothetical protein
MPNLWISCRGGGVVMEDQDVRDEVIEKLDELRDKVKLNVPFSDRTQSRPFLMALSLHLDEVLNEWKY